MLCCSLNSGSNGNCIYVEAGGVGLLFDAGLSGKQTAERLGQRGRNVRNVQAVIISHDHCDHVRCAGILSRKFGLPVCMSAGTHSAAAVYNALGPIADLRHFEPGQSLSFGPVTVQTVRTPHDGAEPVAFVVEAEAKRVGILTDLGCVFAGLAQLLETLDAAFLESNYDPEMLQHGPYPAHLKRRIAGDGGHLSNVESAELASGLRGDRLQWVTLAHLSEINNTPELALRTHRDITGRRRPVRVADRYAVGPMLRVE